MASTAKPLCTLAHNRSEWAGGEVVRVSARWGMLNGKDRKPAQAAMWQARLYRAAKFEGDRAAAKRIVDEMTTDKVVEALIDDTEAYMMRGVPLVIVVPTPAFSAPEEIADDGRGNVRINNVLAPQYAAHLGERLGAEVDTSILQVARVGRTEARDLERFLWQPRFEGVVRPDVAYLLADDVLTWGGTLAGLRSHIVAHGGTVAAYTTLACGRFGDQPLAITDDTLDGLVSQFGSDFRGFWSREIGHDALFLTEAEGRYLARWPEKNAPRSGVSPLQRLRDRFLETAGGRERG